MSATLHIGPLLAAKTHKTRIGNSSAPRKGIARRGGKPFDKKKTKHREIG
jgi:hypothetical protein